MFIENESEFLNNLDRDIKIAEESLKEMNDRYSKLRQSSPSRPFIKGSGDSSMRVESRNSHNAANAMLSPHRSYDWDLAHSSRSPAK